MAPLDPAAPDRLAAERLLADVPSARQLMVHAEPTTARRTPWTRRRMVRWAAPGVVIALAGGAVAAAEALGSSPASVKGEVRCYSVQQLTDNTRQYTDTTQAAVGNQAPPDQSATVAAALDACSALWQIGFIQPGKIVTDVANSGSAGQRTVPSLAACVLSSGEAAVFPGDSSTCARLDLQVLSNRT